MPIINTPTQKLLLGMQHFATGAPPSVNGMMGSSFGLDRQMERRVYNIEDVVNWH